MQSSHNMQVMMVPAGQVTYATSPDYPDFKTKSSLALGILQVVIGSLCILFQIAAIIVYTVLSFVGIGMWAGIPFVVTGIFGILASRKRSKCTVVTLMVMSILSAALAGGMVINQTISVAIGASDYWYDEDDGVALDSLLLIFALTEMIVAIVQAVFCCGVTCCSSTPATSVMYMAQPHSQLAGVQSNVVYTQGVPQGQTPGQQFYMFTQGQMMPVATMPQGSIVPTMVATPANPMASAATASIIPVPQTQVKNEGVPGQASPPPAYVSNPDLQQAQVTEEGSTTDGQEQAHWEKF